MCAYFSTCKFTFQILNVENLQQINRLHNFEGKLFIVLNALLLKLVYPRNIILMRFFQNQQIESSVFLILMDIP